ncbi:hypothetical protein F0P96_10475 [Hymenobacter busanensis]|uniref:Uncharacterized protein n=1 Tax=Hymenobacter busanensis TaxID=2607656 RepID=A0A7L4ZYL5_9BACT|nr:hypothetical protein [Hymenobacter busanensis]KAA9333385.1 hypothetical protein F0P96_10475 [Hymenobacter busanensis]QHJ07935.1 hypothetical protein GUY19_11830 [Hymenobacter busanensis]
MASARFKTLPPNCRIVSETPRPATRPQVPPAATSAAQTDKLVPEPADAPDAPKKPRIVATPDQTKDAALRPRFALAKWPDYEGLRFTAHGLTTAQADTLCRAAEAAGILPQS